MACGFPLTSSSALATLRLCALHALNLQLLFQCGIWTTSPCTVASSRFYPQGCWKHRDPEPSFVPPPLPPPSKTIRPLKGPPSIFLFQPEELDRWAQFAATEAWKLRCSHRGMPGLYARNTANVAQDMLYMALYPL